ncbi:hypothetical protein ALC57_00434 [Trachymyrmex cornetzi]|uniref:Uncharacterized protein n=1 Tax=Trachymyrmex cornetzi TaxID=471704 RepID=A0A151JRY6_9HYME|nr:hypothetical protein ALC57_00434 [Trachymyrmex cornetzi]
MSRKSGLQSSTLSPLVFHVGHHVRTRKKRRRSIYRDRARPSLSASPKLSSPFPRVPRTNARRCRRRRSYRSIERVLGYQQLRDISSPKVNPMCDLKIPFVCSLQVRRRHATERWATRDARRGGIGKSARRRDASPPDGNSCFAT